MNAVRSGIVRHRQPQPAVVVEFGAGGNCDAHLAGGWCHPEPEYRWMKGAESRLLFKDAFAPGDYIIEFELRPFLRQPMPRVQRLAISVNDTLIGRCAVTGISRLGYLIPSQALSGHEGLTVVLDHPDAVRPCDVTQSSDVRLLSLSVERLRIAPVRPGTAGQRIEGTGGIALADVEARTGMAPDRFILNFESLGDSCEFGFLQRRCGAEPFFSLLRFAGVDFPSLLKSIDSGLQDFGAADNIEIYLDDKPKPEFIVREKRHGAIFHTFRTQDEVTEGELRASESQRLVYCARQLRKTIENGRKILVLKRDVRLREEEVLPLYASLSALGPSPLLWVVPADVGNPPGTVTAVLPGLFKGYVGRFAPREDVGDLVLADWLEVCVNAHRLLLEQRQSPA